MSSSAGVPFSVAFDVAKEVSSLLAPLVVRSKAVGSLRRRRDPVGDLEFVVEPRPRRLLLGPPEPDLEPLRREVEVWSTWVRGGDRHWRLSNVCGSRLAMDLFLVHPPAEWGAILAIRTGPAGLGKIAVQELARRGHHCRDGHIQGHQTPDEADFFRLAGLRCLPPHQRDAYLEHLQSGGKP